MVKERANAIRSFVIAQVPEHPADITRVTAEHFGVSRQAVVNHLRRFISEGILVASGRTRDRTYKLKELLELSQAFPIAPGLAEHRVWREFVAPALASVPRETVSMPKNVLEICQYGFSEIFNNAIEHSEGTQVIVAVEVTSGSVRLVVIDDGVGVFQKIKGKLGLEDEREAILELAKGKLTTNPIGHTGEGIFFTSRAFDQFSILSGSLFFNHHEPGHDWLLEDHERVEGTMVAMVIQMRAARTLKGVFDRFATDPGSFDFTKTHVPVELLRYGEENLVSRSQARRLLARFERFREVLLDFHGVPMIGQAFADEVFRVFQRQHPQVRLVWLNATPEVEGMIRRAVGALHQEAAGKELPAADC